MPDDDYLDDPPLPLPSRASGPIVVPLDDDPPLSSDCDRLKVNPEPPKQHLARRKYVPITEGGNPEINTPLPREGTGFKAYKTVETEYGYQSTVVFVIAVAKEWARRYPKPRLLIGDLAVQGVGLTPKMWGHPEGGFHKSHGSGLDFDVQIIRTDDVEKPREVSITNPLYDRSRTQELIDLVLAFAGPKFDCIITADKQLKAPTVIHDAGHVYHVHYRILK